MNPLDFLDTMLYMTGNNLRFSPLLALKSLHDWHQ